jgi:cytochrome c oxidase cbb3-type subunit 2
MKALPALALLLLAAAVAWQISRFSASPPLRQDAVPDGLEVYISEGCIHCHSQYVRPVATDTALWGPPGDPAGDPAQSQPVLYGNRRQGPDLANVGLRRSRDWNRLHLQDPRAVRPGSRMPSYAHLFSGDGRRGEALLDYLQALGAGDPEGWLDHVAGWRPAGALVHGDAAAGAAVYAAHCMPCHGGGGGDGPLTDRLEPAPRDLRNPAGWIWITNEGDAASRRIDLARLVKFGQPGTSMPGTEWLGETELANLVRYLETLKQDRLP